MKRCLFALLTLALLLALAACAAAPVATEPEPPPVEELPAQEPPAPPEPFPGKIAIVTNAVDCNEEEYRTGQQVVEKYGADKVVHVTWPANFMQEQEQMISIVERLGQDPEIKGLVINQAVPGTLATINKLQETRDDIFIAVVQTQENPPDIAASADLILYLDELSYGPPIVQQAHKLGAKTFVHYSFPRHMSLVLLSARRDLMIAECEKLGMEFVYAGAPDPTSYVGVAGAQQFILEDVPKKIAKYGKDTAFFATNCSMQIPLIKAVSDEGGIFPMTCCPSPYHGYPSALGIKVPYYDDGDYHYWDYDYVVSETVRILDEKGVLGRFSTVPAPISIMNTAAGAEYAIKWINGEVPKEGLDMGVLKQIMEDYAGVECFLNAYEEDGTTLENFLLVHTDLLTYGGESAIASNTVSESAPDTIAVIQQGDFLLQGKVLLAYSGQASNITVPASVTSIAGWAFWNCENLRSVTIPNSVTYIEEYAFFGCESLRSITIPDGVSSIEYYAFSDCTSLKSVTIPASVVSIDDDAFFGCDNLTIHCPANSAAEAYAKENNIPYVIE